MYTSVSLVLHLSKYLNLETKSKARKCSDPGVLEPLPRKAPPERVTGEHGGDEETQGGQDRADRVPEYRLFTEIFKGVLGNGSHTSIFNKLGP